jgi:SCP-2 sterol transfer family protein
MAVIYSDAWYQELRRMIDGSAEFARRAPPGRITMAIEVVGDGHSPYVPAEQATHYRLILDAGKVTALEPLAERPPGDGLDFRFTAPASVWESVAAGLLDPITAGLRGRIRIRGDMRFLMQNADAVKVLVDLYAAQEQTDWPLGRPPYAASSV